MAQGGGKLQEVHARLWDADEQRPNVFGVATLSLAEIGVGADGNPTSCIRDVGFNRNEDKAITSTHPK